MFGLFDTGADISVLRYEWKERLGITDGQCVETPILGASGAGTAIYTMVDAALDGHGFRIPVIFSTEVPLDVIGRVGFCDQFVIKHDPVMQTTSFEWIGPQGQPWAAVFEARIQLELEEKARARAKPPETT